MSLEYHHVHCVLSGHFLGKPPPLLLDYERAPLCFKITIQVYSVVWPFLHTKTVFKPPQRHRLSGDISVLSSELSSLAPLGTWWTKATFHQETRQMRHFPKTTGLPHCTVEKEFNKYANHVRLSVSLTLQKGIAIVVARKYSFLPSLFSFSLHLPSLSPSFSHCPAPMTPPHCFLSFPSHKLPVYFSISKQIRPVSPTSWRHRLQPLAQRSTRDLKLQGEDGAGMAGSSWVTQGSAVHPSILCPVSQL